MNLLQMSLTGGIMILMIALIRLLLSGHLPRRSFVTLWTVALIRLLIPFV